MTQCFVGSAAAEKSRYLFSARRIRANCCIHFLRILALSFVGYTAVNAAAHANQCGQQKTPEETWRSWQEAYVSGAWKSWFECHDEGAQAGLFLNSAISTPKSETKTQIIEKYGRCDSRSRASLECVSQHTVAAFFNEMTMIDENSSRSRLSKIWGEGGVRVEGAELISIEQHDDDNATGKIQSQRSDGEIENWTMKFVRVDGRWLVTFKWGM